MYLGLSRQETVTCKCDVCHYLTWNPEDSLVELMGHWPKKLKRDETRPFNPILLVSARKRMQMLPQPRNQLHPT